MIEIPRSNWPGVYALVNLENAKCYVGKTKNLRHRISQHFGKLEKGQHENKTMQEDYINGDMFKVVILREFKKEVNNILLEDTEQLYIALYQATNKQHGYNSRSINLPAESIAETMAQRHTDDLLAEMESRLQSILNHAIENEIENIQKDRRLRILRQNR